MYFKPSGTAFLSRMKLLRAARPTSPLARGRKASASAQESPLASSVALEILSLVQGVMPKVRQPEAKCTAGARLGSPRGAVLQGAVGHGMKVAGQYCRTHRHDGIRDEGRQPVASNVLQHPLHLQSDCKAIAKQDTALGWAESSPGRAGQTSARWCHRHPS